MERNTQRRQPLQGSHQHSLKGLPTHHFLRLGVLFLLLVACMGCEAKKNAKTKGVASCQRLEAGEVEISTLLGELEALIPKIPADISKSPETAATILEEILAKLREITERIDSLHAQDELPCKIPLIKSGDIDGIFEKVYLPHLRSLGRQRAAVTAIAARIALTKPEPEVGEHFRNLLPEFEQTLNEQVTVCERDLGAAQCSRFTEELRRLLATPSAAAVTPAVPPAPAAADPKTPPPKETAH